MLFRDGKSYEMEVSPSWFAWSPTNKRLDHSKIEQRMQFTEGRFPEHLATNSLSFIIHFSQYEPSVYLFGCAQLLCKDIFRIFLSLHRHMRLMQVKNALPTLKPGDCVHRESEAESKSLMRRRIMPVLSWNVWYGGSAGRIFQNGPCSEANEAFMADVWADYGCLMVHSRW